MPKVKVPRKSTHIDMTAMCDVAFLLLTFFMLTSNFTVKEPVIVSTPSSISEIKIPETNMLQIIVDKDGKLFIGIDGKEKKREWLQKVGEKYEIKFSDDELNKFSIINSFGVPVNALKAWLALDPIVRDNPKNLLGVPIDTAITTKNELASWVRLAREVNGNIRRSIKADRSTPYNTIKNLMGTLQTLKENRYNLITSLETASNE